MKRGSFLLVISLVCYCLLGLSRAAASEEEVSAALPASLVTSEILKSKIAEVEAAADKPAGAPNENTILGHYGRCHHGNDERYNNTCR